MSLASIHRYPVKSLQGESLGESALLPNGVAGDRCWAVRDEARGGIRGAKVLHELMHFAAAYDANANVAMAAGVGRVLNATITLPNGETYRSNDPNINETLSAALDHPVTLWPLQPAHDEDHYRRGAPILSDPEQEFRRLFARGDDLPLPDLSVFPPELAEFESPPGTYFDAYPILLCTTGSLARVQQAHAGVDDQVAIDMRRFRPNLVIETDDDERQFAGRRARLGACELKFEIPCPRCIMTTLPFADLDKDPKIMRTLVTGFGGDFGIYASVAVPGDVRVGDELVWLD
ncbi:MAG: MOSC domain-containing protein [Pseudomonadota bacterium]